ncbi:hypothetical protein F4818DRAFT_436848 [Hypoxylon cercidicola]|nr:hypothetical protein F4818DRAFT_436848 [Hypoxylon cercidicola]
MARWQLKTSSGCRRPTAIVIACSIGLVLLFLWSQHDHHSASRISTTPHHPTVVSAPQHQFASRPGRGGGEDVAIDLSHARAPFVSWPLRRVCAEAAHVPGLTFLCDSNSGGPGNMRNYVLTCVRYAVDAGAAALVVPALRARAPDDPADLFRERRPFAYMFDEPHFRAALADACPRLALYAALADVPGAAARARRERRALDRVVERVTPKHFGGSRAGCDPRDPHRYADRFGAAFREHLRASAAERGWPASDGVDNPRLVRLSWGVLWDWPVLRDGPEFAATYGGLLRFRPDVLDLADGIVDAMRALAATTRGTEAAAGRSFLGVHLRTEADALARWPSYENQTKGYLREAAARGYQGRAAYLATGNETEARRFGGEAMASLQLDVRTKYGLLEGREEELARLKALSWDQQALVDFVVLLNCDYFVGVSPSSFSINVALKRHLKEEGLYTRPWRVGGRGDGRSWLVGRYDRYWEDWLFMFDGMWP